MAVEPLPPQFAVLQPLPPNSAQVGQSSQQLPNSPASQLPLPQQGTMAGFWHAPPLQESLVHALPSLHKLELSDEQEPPAQTRHVPLHTVPSATLVPRQVAPSIWHVSESVHALPSLHACPGQQE
jgi:hypothetical protein